LNLIVGTICRRTCVEVSLCWWTSSHKGFSQTCKIILLWSSRVGTGCISRKIRCSSLSLPCWSYSWRRANILMLNNSGSCLFFSLRKLLQNNLEVHLILIGFSSWLLLLLC
jgi:hypothetical protein